MTSSFYVARVQSLTTFIERNHVIEFEAVPVVSSLGPAIATAVPSQQLSGEVWIVGIQPQSTPECIHEPTPPGVPAHGLSAAEGIVVLRSSLPLGWLFGWAAPHGDA